MTTHDGQAATSMHGAPAGMPERSEGGSMEAKPELIVGREYRAKDRIALGIGSLPGGARFRHVGEDYDTGLPCFARNGALFRFDPQEAAAKLELVGAGAVMLTDPWGKLAPAPRPHSEAEAFGDLTIRQVREANPEADVTLVVGWKGGRG